MLAARKDVQKVEHFKALPYGEMNSFMARLRLMAGAGPLALQFLIYTATRTSDVRFATWSEIDTKEKVWTIPRGRMKGRKTDTRPDHKIPLSAEALIILEKAKAITDGSEYLFPGGKIGAPLSENGMLKVLERMEAGVTSHGFRSSFRDWCAECTNHPREVAEMALAHTIENEVERAYRRGDLFQKRVALMNDWAKHCNTAAHGDNDDPQLRRSA